MKTYPVTLAGRARNVHFVQSTADYQEVERANAKWQLEDHILSLDTESTSFKGMYKPDWRLRMVQFGNADTAYCVPVENGANRDLVETIISTTRQWTLHNAPHDVLALDRHFGYETGLLGACIDTRILAHLYDSRPKHEGGLGLRLKELAAALVDPHATDGETELKAEFKELRVPDTGKFYKTDTKYPKGHPRHGEYKWRKGDQRYRKAHLNEGWRLIPIDHPAYVIYSGMDVLLTSAVFPELLNLLAQEYDERVEP